ncbi:TauD/TfdA family dioxygenase [Pseudomonas boanensis]|uniref:TauD/TfdA family dioxygenase n=1 Tax=Metapseudomonas boanensis TaxID=2822138 RepID=UPI0035D4F59B
MSKLEFIFKQLPPSITVRKGIWERDLPALWLRERTQDPSQLDSRTQQRLFDSHSLDAEIRLLSVDRVSADQAWLEFNDGHRALFDFSLFASELDGTSVFPEAAGWDSSLDRTLVTFGWRKIEEDVQFMRSLEAYLKYGFIILQDVPTEPETILEVGRKFGYIKETNFGRYFEVYSKPDANDLAYTTVHLGPHTDNPYRDPVPGIQLLHCLINETSGGLSTLVDSVSVVDQLAAEDPEGFVLLKNTPVRFRFIDKGTELVTHRTMIQTDSNGRTLGVHYSPRLDNLPLLDIDQMKAFHHARKRLGELFTDPAYEIRFPLRAGELMLFDNSRVLHGRTSFDRSEGRRHLQGCYIDLDGPRERYASTLMKQKALKDAA